MLLFAAVLEDHSMGPVRQGRVMKRVEVNIEYRPADGDGDGGGDDSELSNTPLFRFAFHMSGRDCTHHQSPRLSLILPNKLHPPLTNVFLCVPLLAWPSADPCLGSRGVVDDRQR